MVNEIFGSLEVIFKEKCGFQKLQNFWSFLSNNHIFTSHKINSIHRAPRFGEHFEKLDLLPRQEQLCLEYMLGFPSGPHCRMPFSTIILTILISRSKPTDRANVDPRPLFKFFQTVARTIGFIQGFKKVLTWWRISWSFVEWNQWIFPTIEEGASLFAGKFVEFRTFYQDTIQDMLQKRVPRVQNLSHGEDLPRAYYFWGINYSCAANCSQEMFVTT